MQFHSKNNAESDTIILKYILNNRVNKSKIVYINKKNRSVELLCRIVHIQNNYFKIM